MISFLRILVFRFSGRQDAAQAHSRCYVTKKYKITYGQLLIPVIPSLHIRLESSAFLEQRRWIPAFTGMTNEA